MRKHFLFLLIFIVVALIAYFYFIERSKVGEVCFKGNCYDVELAKTEAERERGLMRRTQMDSDKGMLFVFDSDGIYPFWMKNTLIPLDMIWLDGDGKVVYIYKNARPCEEEDECSNIIPPDSARYVLEINAGEADRIGLKEGDELILNSKLYE
jgi:hypothetical protein